MFKKIAQIIIACLATWGFIALIAIGMDKEIDRQERINSERRLIEMCQEIEPDKTKQDCLKG